MDKYSVLKQYFGHSEFRPGQQRLIDGVLAGRDVFGVMPTGGGKSLCYQIPALLLPGVTLVISPLISLMKDQVSALKEAGVSAAYINSSLSLEQRKSVYSRARSGEYKLIYIAPERLEGDGFLSFAKGVEVSLVAVDEAHCISQWGQDFRPSYLRITQFINSLTRRPVVAAFTATATEQVRQDIVRLLALRDEITEITGFDRPNLFFDVQRPQSKSAALTSLVLERKNKSGIIYCSTRASVEQVCAALCRQGVSATRYHAGLEDAERRRNQDDFQFDRKMVMVATNAFGMGIDKSNVSYVIHYNMPKSLEAYYQEAGRAGRDGEAADCVLLFSAGDVVTAKYLIENGNDNDALSDEEQAAVRQRDYARLEVMTGYCKTAKCLRGYILDYFGQTHEETCANCGNCKGSYQKEDITVSAQMIMSCVSRVRERLGYNVGKTLIIQALRGSKDARVLSLGLDRLSTYGLMKSDSAQNVRDCIDFLEAEGYLFTNPDHSTLELTEKSKNVLFRGEKVEMAVRSDRASERPRRKRPKAVEVADNSLLTVLKNLRNQLAQNERMPAYIVFSNATLTDMAERLPRSMDELLEVSGVGKVKAAKYGKEFLEAIAGFSD